MAISKVRRQVWCLFQEIIGCVVQLIIDKVSMMGVGGSMGSEQLPQSVW